MLYFSVVNFCYYYSYGRQL